jgi:dUTP pyrophosphatase
MGRPTVLIKRLPHSEGLSLPSYETEGSAGLDLRAAIEEDIVLNSLERAVVPTGLCLGIPVGYEGQVRPRSGLAFRHGLTVTNSPGTIDSDYRGELKVLLVNLGLETVTISRGMRCAQIIISPVSQAILKEVPSLDETERGRGGFGSTGT